MSVNDDEVAKITYVADKYSYYLGELGAFGEKVLIRGDADLNHRVQLAEVLVYAGEIGLTFYWNLMIMLSYQLPV